MYWRRAKTGTLYWDTDRHVWEWEILYDPEPEDFDCHCGHPECGAC